MPILEGKTGRLATRPRRLHLGSVFELKPRVNLAARVQARPGHAWGPRTVADSQLVFLLSGSVHVRMGSIERVARRGDCIFYGPHSPHWILTSEDEPCAFVYIHFDWDAHTHRPVHPYWGVWECGVNDLDLEPVQHWLTLDGEDLAFPHLTTIPALEATFLDVAREFRERQPGAASLLSAIVKEIIIRVLRRSIEPSLSASAKDKVQRAIMAVQDVPAKAWRIPELASLCGYHPTYFTEIFRKATGLTPKQFLIQERIRFAQEQLLHPGTLEEVAERTGFSSVHYFCRTFKAETGITPTEYRRLRGVG